MMYNLVLGIVLPWTVALFLVRKSERYVVVVMSPFATTLGYTLNTHWTYQGFGYMLPKFQHNWTLAGIPCELGMFPVTVSLFIIMYRRTNKLLLLGLLTGKLLYLNGWNLFETYIEYVVGFIANLLYWQLILRVSRISSRT